MGKGDWRRPSQIPDDVEAANYEAVFGKKKLNVMSDEEREEMLRDRDRAASGDVPDDGHDGGDVHQKG